jgi:hypothetical protein
MGEIRRRLFFVDSLVALVLSVIVVSPATARQPYFDVVDITSDTPWQEVTICGRYGLRKRPTGEDKGGISHTSLLTDIDGSVWRGDIDAAEGLVRIHSNSS